MAAMHFSDADFKEKVLKNSLPVMVDFYADWCGPCRLAAPIVEELAGEYEGKVVIGKLNVDESVKTASSFGVISIPTVILFKGGKEVGRKVGFGGKAAYEELLKQA